MIRFRFHYIVVEHNYNYCNSLWSGFNNTTQKTQNWSLSHDNGHDDDGGGDDDDSDEDDYYDDNNDDD